MKTNKIFICLLSAFLLASCDNELNIENKQNQDSSVSLSTETGISNILTGAYSIAATGDVYGGRILTTAELLGVTGVTSSTEFRYRGTFNDCKNFYYKEILATNGFVLQIYARNYEMINAANIVIENIDKVQDPERKKTMIAEARFLRGLAHFDLVRFFAKPFESGKSNDGLGVVIRDKAIYDYNIDHSKERSTIKQVYDFVLSDLQAAYADLPEDNGFYASKYAAKALLARVYLQQGDFVNARDAANDVIENGGFELSDTYAAAFNHDSNQKEDIFAIQITKQTGDNQANNLYASEGNGGRGGDIEIRSKFLSRFDDVNDVRRNFYYVNPDNGRRLTSKFINPFGDVGIIRLAEMYLIRAEANFKEGTAVGNTPLADINILRARAKATLKTSLTENDIWWERRYELHLEGFLIHDIKRTKRSIDVYDDGDELIPYDADYLVLPIPLREMDTNKSITQNPGYSS